MIIRDAGTGSGTKKLPTVTNPLSGTTGSPSSTILDRGAQLNGITKTINNAPTSNTNNVSPAPSGGGGGASGGSGSNGMVSAAPAQNIGVNSYEDYLNAMYAAQRERELTALENEYNAAIGELEREKAAIAPMYQGARNQAAGVNAREMQAMNEMFNAAGLSSGGRAQGAIAQSNTLQGELSALELAEAQALAEIESQRTQLANQYQGKVRQAIMNNEMDKAAAIYEELVRYDNAMVEAAREQAELRAKFGDYSGYAALGWGQDVIDFLNDAAKPKYSGGGGGGDKTPEYTDYYALLGATGTSDYGDAYQKLLGMGLSDAEAKNVAKGYTGDSSTPTTATPTQSLTDANVISVYGALKKGNMTPEEAGAVLNSYLAINPKAESEVGYLMSMFGY